MIAPIGHRSRGQTYNINADVAAGEVAGALKAEKLILLTDVEGVKDEKGKLMPTLDAAQAKKMIASGVIGEGMIPKVECCLDALRAGVAQAHIIDGRVSPRGTAARSSPTLASAPKSYSAPSTKRRRAERRGPQSAPIDCRDRSPA